MSTRKKDIKPQNSLNQQNIRKKLLDIGLRNDLLDMTPKSSGKYRKVVLQQTEKLQNKGNHQN